MKHLKLFIYGGINLFLLIMAMVVFKQVEVFTVNQSATGNLSDPVYSNLILSISLLVFLPFAVISFLMVYEFISLRYQKRNSANPEQGKSLESLLKDSVHAENIKSEKEKDLDKSADEKKNRLSHFLTNEVGNKSLKGDNFIAERILSVIAKVFEISQGELFLTKGKSDKQSVYKLAATYAMHIPEKETIEFNNGEGLVGQVAKNGKPLYLDKLPDGFLNAKSGLGNSNPNYLLFIPWKDQNDRTFAVAELASFKNFDNQDIKILEGLSEQIHALLNP